MPEGDTVLLAATRMHTALAGQRLVATDFRVPRFATAHPIQRDQVGVGFGQ
jgi:endonuclease VIII